MQAATVFEEQKIIAILGLFVCFKRNRIVAVLVLDWEIFDNERIDVVVVVGE